MSPETRAFLETVRGAEDPAADDERRVFEAVRTTIAGQPPLMVNGGAARPRGVSVVSSGPGLKLLGALAGISASVTVVALVVSNHRAPEPQPLPSHTARSSIAPPTALTSAPERPVAVPQHSASAAPVRAKASRSASLREELELLAEVQAALERGDGAAALRRLDAHVTVDRQFTAERRAARILALCALGRVQEARDGAALFLRENPGSVQRTAVERSCAGAQSTERR